MNTLTLPPHLKRQVDADVSGLDIMHGELKNLMLECEQELINLSPLQDAPIHKYFSGSMDTLEKLYNLTYQLSFAIGDQHNAT